MNKDSRKDDVRAYRIGGIPIMAVMAILIVTGIVLTLILHYFFG